MEDSKFTFVEISKNNNAKRTRRPTDTLALSLTIDEPGAFYQRYWLTALIVFVFILEI